MGLPLLIEEAQKAGESGTYTWLLVGQPTTEDPEPDPDPGIKNHFWE